MGSSTRQSSNTTRPHIRLVVQSSFSKLCFQSLAIVSMMSPGRLKQDRLYLGTHSKMNHIYLTKDQKFLSGHSQSIQLDKSYSITSNTVVIKSSGIFTRSTYKCTKCLIGFAMPVLQEIPVRRYWCSTQFILKVKIKPLMVFAFLNTSQRFVLQWSKSNVHSLIFFWFQCHDLLWRYDIMPWW